MKSILLITLTLLTFSLSAQITNAWTTTIPTADLPSGAVVPTVAKLTSPNKENFTMNLDRETYDDANEVNAFAAIGAAVKTAIDSNFVEDVWRLNPTLDTDCRTVITSIKPGFDNFDIDDLPNQYTAATDVFIITGYFEWKVATP